MSPAPEAAHPLSGVAPADAPPPAPPALALGGRKIIHVDMDAFYAAIEVLDDPSLKGLPLIVGGRPNSRGVVATASYEARVFGIRSAMSSAHAVRLCPQAVFRPPRFERYKEISRQIHQVLCRYSSMIEPLSLDEAYLDVTGNELGLYATEIARRIRADIRQECGLTASAGVAPNKMLAKIASDLRKPDGLAVILPDQVAAFIATLPVKRIHGIGPVTAAKLAAHGITLCRDVSQQSLAAVQALLGEQFGAWLYRRAQGLDDRPVETTRERKSYGQEETFSTNLSRSSDIIAEIRRIAMELAEGLQERAITGRTVTLKVRYPDFVTATRALTLPAPTNDAAAIVAAALQLLAKTDAVQRHVRLLGVSLSRLQEPTGATAESEWPRYYQPSLFGD